MTEETDSERNIRIGKTVGATVVAASGTAVGRNDDRNPTLEWKRAIVDEVVSNAHRLGVTDPEEIRRLKVEKLQELKDF